MAEWVCRPHAWDYSLEGPLSALRMWSEVDEATQKVVAYHGHMNMMEQETTIWMDGRPHPPANALHTWSGFSTGEWDGNDLVVTTTHLKEAYIRRTGLSHSDQAVSRTRWRRLGNYLQATVIIYDPVTLAEPYIRSTMMWINDPAGTMQPYPCEEATETAVRAGSVPNFLPGKSRLPGLDPEPHGPVRHAGRAAPRRRRHDAAGVHREDEGDAEAGESDDRRRRGGQLANSQLPTANSQGE